MEDRVFEDGVKALAHALQRLRDAYLGVGQGADAAERGQQRRQRHAVDRRVPDLRGDVMLERGDLFPLTRPCAR